MALTLINLSGFQSGVEVDETALNIQSYEASYAPEVFREVPDKVGETRGRVVSTKPSVEVSIEGHVAGSTGLMAATFVAAQTVANDSALFGRDTGAFYLQPPAVERQTADGMRSISLRLIARPGITT